MQLVQRIDSDIDLLSLHQFAPETYPFLLESALISSSGAHFDILFGFPQCTLLLDKSGLSFVAASKSQDLPPYSAPNSVPNIELTNNLFLSAFDQWWQQERLSSNSSNNLPFTGGWFVFLSYELAAQIEPSLKLPSNAQCEPIAFATRIPFAVLKDHQNHCLFVVAENGARSCMDKAVEHIHNLESSAAANSVNDFLVKQLTEEDPEKFINSVNRIKRYIKNGDVFQVNLSRWWNVLFDADISPVSVYRQLRKHNPSPFFGLANFHNSSIISSSPERLVRVIDNKISTRPIAGTRPRGVKTEDDLKFRNELMAHPKERAEHIMLIDLERNDLGRLCEPGSIMVDELMITESYAHVHHIVSNVQGELRENTTPGAVIRAMFPGGTITGCPKVRCMEIIAELENSGRGAYTGSMGYINRDGSMDFNILIRTMVQCGKNLHLRAGAGIVADSIADKELQETRAKARGLIKALGLDG